MESNLTLHWKFFYYTKLVKLISSDGRSSYQIFLIITYLINGKPVDGDKKLSMISDKCDK